MGDIDLQNALTRHGKQLSSMAAQLFGDMLKGTPDDLPGNQKMMQTLVDDRWEEVKIALGICPNTDSQDYLCHALWNLATDFLAPIQFEEEVIPNGSVRDRAAEVMRWALLNATPKATADFWTEQAAESLWNLRMRCDVVTRFELTAKHLHSLTLIDARFTEVLDEQQQLASKLAASAFAEALSIDGDIKRVVMHHLSFGGPYLESSYCLFWVYLENMAHNLLVERGCDELTEQETLSRALVIRKWAGDMLQEASKN